MKGAEVSTDRTLVGLCWQRQPKRRPAGDDPPMTRPRSAGLAPLSVPSGAATRDVV
jgi:hypothetical protein